MAKVTAEVVEATRGELLARSRALRLQASNLRVDGVPFDLSLYPYLVDYLDDDHSRLVALKGAQLGWTIATALKSIDRLVRDEGRAPIRGLLYLFPREQDVSDFSKARFSRLLTDNRVLGAHVKDTDAANIKQIGSAYAYFRGAGSAPGLKSVPIDDLDVDERDEMDDDMVELAYHRLDGSEDPHLAEFSTPTLPEYGVAKAYDESDGLAWHLRCRRCREWTCLEDTFPECLVERADGRIYYGCRKCHEPLVLRGPEVEAEWVPRRPNVTERRGYAISQLNSPRRTAATILGEYRKAERDGRFKEFYNSTLGLPWAELDDVLTREAIREATTTYPRAAADLGPCALGVDPGVRVLHWFALRWVGSSLARCPAYGVVRDFADLDEIRRRFNVTFTLIDEGAERRAVTAYKDTRPGVYGCLYEDRAKSAHLVDWNDAERLVKCDRTSSLDDSHRAIIDRRLTLPRIDDTHRELLEPQLMNLARQVVRKKETGDVRVRWVVQGTKNDHLRHAANLAWLALNERVPVAMRGGGGGQRSRTFSERGPGGL